MLPVLANLLVFFTSGAVLVLEILAGRLLAPYVGVSLETFTGIIGTVLAGISVGTWLGGRLADRVDPRRTLGPLLVVGGALAVLALPVVRLLGAAQLGADPVAIVLQTAAAFFLPAAVLSAVSPTVVKLQLSSLAETGTVVGRLSALGTAGAIFGTFTTGFVLVAALPSQPIVIGVGAVLVAVGLWLWGTLGSRRRDRPLVAAAVVAGAVAAALGAALPFPCAVESAYYCAVVVDDPDRPGGRTLVLDRARNSYVDLDDPTYLEFSYAQTMGDVLAALGPAEEPIDALFVGGGGFTLPRYVNATRPGSISTVLELDPTVVRIAEQRLGLQRGPGLRIRTGDARLGLTEEPAARYDVVIGDAFSGFSVPWHLTTREFVREIKRVLRPGGIYAINLIDGPPLGFARAEAATLRDVFEHVAVLVPPARAARREGGNFVLVAADAPLPLDGILARNARRGDDEVAVTGQQLTRFIDGAAVLTDDFAPVDQLLSPLG